MTLPKLSDRKPRDRRQFHNDLIDDGEHERLASLLDLTRSHRHAARFINELLRLLHALAVDRRIISAMESSVTLVDVPSLDRFMQRRRTEMRQNCIYATAGR